MIIKWFKKYHQIQVTILLKLRIVTFLGKTINSLVVFFFLIFPPHLYTGLVDLSAFDLICCNPFDA